MDYYLGSKINVIKLVKILQNISFYLFIFRVN